MFWAVCICRYGEGREVCTSAARIPFLQSTCIHTWTDSDLIACTIRRYRVHAVILIKIDTSHQPLERNLPLGSLDAGGVLTFLGLTTQEQKLHQMTDRSTGFDFDATTPISLVFGFLVWNITDSISLLKLLLPPTCVLHALLGASFIIQSTEPK